MDIFNIEPMKDLLKKVNSNSELEIIFNKSNPLTINKFIDMLKYMTVLSKNKNYKLVKESTLDVSYSMYVNKDIVNYRITISNIDNINKIINNVKLRKNHVIFSLLVNYLLNDYKDMSIMKKTKLDKNMVDIENYDMRIRLSDENEVSKDELKKLLNLDENERHNIRYRFKERISVVLSADDKHELKIDLTQTKQVNNINDITKAISRYELEMDLSVFDKFDVKKIIDKMNEYSENIYKNLNTSNNIITTQEQRLVLDKYKELVYGDKENLNKDLAGLQVTSLEIQYLVDQVPSKYCVTDKADGDRYFLFITEGIVYLISNNLHVIKTDHISDKKYDNTLIDGELIYIGKDKKYIFLGFDILFENGVDIRDTIKMNERYAKLSENIQKIFGSKFKYTKYEGDFDILKIRDHTEKQVKSYITDLNNSIKNDKSLFLIKYKFYAFPQGGNSCEIFNYSTKMWELYTKELDCPYILDGLIYAPLEQKYTRSLKETKYKNLKWKPKEKNSIDFYIEFEKDNKNEILNVFDDSNARDVSDTSDIGEQSLLDSTNIKNSGKIYRIANLYVGKIKNGIEYPVLFHKDKNGYIAHLFINDNQARDIEGNVIQDKTVVEFSYLNDPLIPESQRWIPLRTRFDKTEMVNKYRKKYGNNEEISEKVWRSILMPVDISDLQILGDPKTFENHLSTMRSKIDVKLIETARSEDVYYQLKTDLAKPQRDFHNWIKSSLIYNYCSKELTGNKMIVLDIGIGRGGDIQKYFSARIQELVGIDTDSNGIFSATDGAYSRYNNFKKKFPAFPKMTFLIADGGAKLNMSDQIQAIGSMDDKNKQALKDIFGAEDGAKSMKFDTISSQFVLHYMFKDDITFNNLCDNINKLLKPNGYLIFTTMDGDLIHKEFQKTKGKIQSYYTNKDGVKKEFMHINSKYDLTKEINSTGNAIDFYNSSFQEEGSSRIEFLISEKFVVENFKEKCNLELVEAVNFQNIYHTFKSFITETAKYEENPKTREYFADTSKFYDLTNEINKASFELTRLNKLYVFQKRGNIIKETSVKAEIKRTSVKAKVKKTSIKVKSTKNRF
jgi:SAM-dependent methyltransferase